MPAAPLTFTWPSSTYAFADEAWRERPDLGARLLVCVAHRGLHAYYDGACVVFADGRPPKHYRAALYAEDLRERAAEAERAQPPVVTVDTEALAAAIGTALYGLIEDRRRQRAERRPSPPSPTATPGAPPPPAPTEAPIHGVRVWTEGGTVDGGGA